MEKIDMLKTLLAISTVVVLTGCGNSVTGTNTALDVSHKNGPDCTQSGCHPGFGAGGTVFESEASAPPASGIRVKAKFVETGAEITLGTTDSLGNFHYNQELSGYYNMAVGDKPWSQPHSLPERKGCNSCHTWPPSEGTSGRLSE